MDEDKLKKSTFLSEEFSSISAEYSCIPSNPEEKSTASRVGRGKCMKKLLLWKERCDAEETAKKSTARGQGRPGKSLRLLLENRLVKDLDSEEIRESVHEAKKPKTETNPKPKPMKTETNPKIKPKPTKTETTVKQRIAKVLKNNKVKNTKARRLFSVN